MTTTELISVRRNYENKAWSRYLSGGLWQARIYPQKAGRVAFKHSRVTYYFLKQATSYKRAAQVYLGRYLKKYLLGSNYFYGFCCNTKLRLEFCFSFLIIYFNLNNLSEQMSGWRGNTNILQRKKELSITIATHSRFVCLLTIECVSYTTVQN